MGSYEDKVFEVKNARLKKFFKLLAEYLISSAIFLTISYFVLKGFSKYMLFVLIPITYGLITNTLSAKDFCVTICREVVLITVGKEDYKFPIKDYLEYGTRNNGKRNATGLVFQTIEGEKCIELPYAKREMLMQIDEAINAAKASTN